MPIMPRKLEPQALFTIAVFSRRTGISPGTLRIWNAAIKSPAPLAQAPETIGFTRKATMTGSRS